MRRSVERGRRRSCSGRSRSPLLVLGPALGPGFLLVRDMVWVPDLALRADSLGLGSGLPRAVPSDAVVAVLDEIVPGMLLQKLVLVPALAAGGVGAARLLRPDGDRPGSWSGWWRSPSTAGTRWSPSGCSWVPGRCWSGTPCCPGSSSRPAAGGPRTGCPARCWCWSRSAA